ncbi:unnamed protein product [Lampetra fluviatilis]
MSARERTSLAPSSEGIPPAVPQASSCEAAPSPSTRNTFTDAVTGFKAPPTGGVEATTGTLPVQSPSPTTTSPH